MDVAPRLDQTELTTFSVVFLKLNIHYTFYNRRKRY